MPEKMKQVAVRMEPSLQAQIMRHVKKSKESFGQFMRTAAIALLKERAK
jgi:hypothetical protein